MAEMTCNLVAGSLKITPTIARTTSMLAWGMLNFGEGYNKSDTWQTGMETLKWNTDYLLKTILDDPTDSATSEAAEFYIIYQVALTISDAECCCGGCMQQLFSPFASILPVGTHQLCLE